MLNKNITIYRCEQGSEAWHELRCGRMTASKFKDMMSKISTKGYQDLIYSTAGQIISGETEPTYSNATMERGIEMEPEARSFYEDIYGIDVDEVGFVTNDKIHPEFVGISPDGMIPEENGIIEIKCPMMKTHVAYLLKDVLPNEYKWQVQGQLLVTGAEYCDFMSYYPGIKPFIKRILPDKEMHNQLLAEMQDAVKQVERTVEKIKNS